MHFAVGLPISRQGSVCVCVRERESERVREREGEQGRKFNFLSPKPK